MNTNQKSLSMRDAINAGVYFHVRICHWASGGQDVIADDAKEAALLVGCQHAQHGFLRGVEPQTEVFRHLRNSTIGCAVLESCGVFETLTADHYAI